MTWRVYMGSMDAALHLALDEVLFSRAKKGEYTLLLPDYSSPCVVLAHDQHISDYLGDGTIAYTRCFTPGGAMLCDKNVLPFSIIVPRTVDSTGYRKDAKEAHKHFGGLICRILQDLCGARDLVMGEQFYIKVQRSPRNLPLVGTSQRVENDALLYHGVITLDPWDADRLNTLIRLRTRGDLNEYDKIKELPYVRAYTPLPLDDLKTRMRLALAEQIAGTRDIHAIPEAVRQEANDLVAAVYHNDAWRKDAQHPSWDRVSCNRLQEGLGFCMLGSEFQQ